MARGGWYEDDDEEVTIHGIGHAWGQVTGKVKTRQIGFVLQKPSVKSKPKQQRQTARIKNGDKRNGRTAPKNK